MEEKLPQTPVKTLQEYTEPWYEWEDICHNLDASITTEQMIAINSGFGTAEEGISKLIKLNWDEEHSVYMLKIFRIRRSRKIDFYKGAGLYEIISHKGATPVKVIMEDRFNVYLNREMFILDSTNAPIYSANEFFGLSLYTNKRIIDYYFFFFFNVRGRHGHFLPVSGVNEVQNLLNVSVGGKFEKVYVPKKGTKVELHGLDFELKPIHPKERSNATEEQNDYETKIQLELAHVIFKDSLFSSRVSIDPQTGRIDLSNEELLIEFEDSNPIKPTFKTKIDGSDTDQS